MAEDAGVADTTFFPGFVSGAFVEEGFAVEEHFGAEGADYFLLNGLCLLVNMMWFE
jgi:hypothetical protein